MHLNLFEIESAELNLAPTLSVFATEENSPHPAAARTIARLTGLMGHKLLSLPQPQPHTLLNSEDALKNRLNSW